MNNLKKFDEFVNEEYFGGTVLRGGPKEIGKYAKLKTALLSNARILKYIPPQRAALSDEEEKLVNKKQELLDKYEVGLGGLKDIKYPYELINGELARLGDDYGWS